MSDNWNSWLENQQAETPARNPQPPVEEVAPAPAEREGLPRNFRMRADRHYIDQLTAQSAGHPVRMISVDQIAATTGDADVRLVESIRDHGIVHPLLVSRHGAGYTLVAGRRRLAAARTLRLDAVPCLVHDLTDADAIALALADNLTVAAGTPEPEERDASEGLRLVERHLSKVRRYADVLADSASGFERSTLDLLQAHAWRATLVADGLSLIARAPFPGHRERALRSIVDELIERFAPECRLAGVTIRAEGCDGLSTSGLNDRELACGLGGAIVAMLPLVEQAVRPTIVIRASATETAGVGIDVVQAEAAVPRRLVADFFEDDPTISRPGGYEAAIGALTAKALAERHDGSATFQAIDRGSRLTLMLMRRS